MADVTIDLIVEGVYLDAGTMMPLPVARGKPIDVNITRNVDLDPDPEAEPNFVDDRDKSVSDGITVQATSALIKVLTCFQQGLVSSVF